MVSRQLYVGIVIALTAVIALIKVSCLLFLVLYRDKLLLFQTNDYKTILMMWLEI